MRIIRILKLSKIMRLFRVIRFFKELRLMLLSVQKSFVSLFWAIIMLTFILYVFSLVLLQGLANAMVEAGDAIKVEDVDILRANFGSMAEAMLSLFKVGTGGDDWSLHYKLVSFAGLPYSLLFLFYVAFITFAIMNILTGMIVDNIVKIGDRDEETLLLEFRRARNESVDDVMKLFRRLDTDDSGTITFEEFQEGVRSEQVAALMAAIELDIKDAELFFDMLLSAAPQGDVRIESFVEGCLKMKGMATSIDIQCLSFETRLIHQNMLKLHEDLAEKVGIEPPLVDEESDFAEIARRHAVQAVLDGTQACEHSSASNSECLLGRWRRPSLAANRLPG